MDSKRKNFTPLEIKSLMCSVEKYQHIIENKTTNAATNRQKQAAWRAVEEDFNSIPGVSKRNMTQLLNLYKNLKRKAAQNKAKEGIQILKTVGGNNEVSVSSAVEEIHDSNHVSSPCVVIMCHDHELTSSDRSVTPEEDTTGLEEESCTRSMEGTVSENLAKNNIIVQVKQEIDTELPIYKAATEVDSYETAHSDGDNRETPIIEYSNTACNSSPIRKKQIQMKTKTSASAASKAANALINQAELKQKILLEQHELTMQHKKEEHALKMQILQAQLKLVNSVNEKMANGEVVHICINGQIM